VDGQVFSDEVGWTGMRFDENWGLHAFTCTGGGVRAATYTPASGISYRLYTFTIQSSRLLHEFNCNTAGPTV